MAACLIFKRPLKSFSSYRLKMPEPKGNSHFQIFTATFATMWAARQVNIANVRTPLSSSSNPRLSRSSD